VPAHCHNKSLSLNGQAAQHKSEPLPWRGKKYQRCDREKKSSRHDQQSSEFHSRSFLRNQQRAATFNETDLTTASLVLL
jgi:hypothetical protein